MVYCFSTLDEFTALRAQIKGELNALAEDAANLLFVAINEAVSNAIFHGNKNDKNKKTLVVITSSEEEICIVVQDEGDGFSRADTVEAEEDIFKESGRGLCFMEYGTDSCEYNEKGNEVTLIKKIRRSMAS
ncbi:MAG: putative anti-sigma regulatory factor, serine/threonine protein kinase [Firmicutes bacterium]|nr:putative anti-sigma regulatory factor, serine/threonine protein kinase [Bacillota bacterium]